MSPRARKQPETTNTMRPTAASTGAATMTPPSQISTPSSPESRYDRIAQRAYALYERRGGTGGSPMDDWLQAEREIDGEG
jgi:hypothetical protein